MKNREKGEKWMQKFLRQLERFSQSLLSPLSYLSAAGLLVLGALLTSKPLCQALPVALGLGLCSPCPIKVLWCRAPGSSWSAACTPPSSAMRLNSSLPTGSVPRNSLLFLHRG